MSRTCSNFWGFLGIVCLLYARTTSARRDVSFWYAPSSYGGEDIEAVVELLANHSGIVTSLMIYCGHSIGQGGVLIYDKQTEALCTGNTSSGGSLFSKLKAINVIPEIVLDSGTNNVSDYRIFWANESHIAELAAVASAMGAGGINLDLEPQVGIPSSTAADATLYAAFNTKLRVALKKNGARLTICVATWSTMLRQFAVLGPSADRIMNMETYSANSLAGWLVGDGYGGYYKEFVKDTVPRSSAAPAIGSWPAKCGKNLCWTSTEASAAPRIKQMISDNITEAAVFRIVQVNGTMWPQNWWWPYLKQFASS